MGGLVGLSGVELAWEQHHTRHSICPHTPSTTSLPTYRAAVLIVTNVQSLPREQAPVLCERGREPPEQRGGDAQRMHQSAALEGGDTELGGVRL